MVSNTTPTMGLGEEGDCMGNAAQDQQAWIVSNTTPTMGLGEKGDCMGSAAQDQQAWRY
jgi:hypothetical protein